MGEYSERLRALGREPILGLKNTIDFGKFKGKMIVDVIERFDPRYIEWCLQEKIFELDNEAYLRYKACIDLLNAETQRREDDNNDDFSLRFGPRKFYE